VTAEVIAASTCANREAHLEGAEIAYQIALAFGLLACICAWFIPSIDHKKLNARTKALQQNYWPQLEEQIMEKTVDALRHRWT